MIAASNTTKNETSFLKAFLFGSLSGTFTTILLQPMDRIRTISQQLESRNKSMFAITRQTISPSHGGSPLELWRGLSPSLARIVPGAAMYFGCIHFVSPRLSSTAVGARLPPAAQNFLVGCGARVFVGSVLQPLTVLKTRLESSVYGKSNMRRELKAMFTGGGIAGLWRGLAPTILRDAPFSGLYLAVYRYELGAVARAKAAVAAKDAEGDENRGGTTMTNVIYRRALDHDFALNLACGLCAGALACLVTQPFDVLKTMAVLYPQKFSSMSRSIAHIYLKNIGLKMLFRGFVLRTSKRTLGTALSWALFDKITKTQFGRPSDSSNHKS